MTPAAARGPRLALALRAGVVLLGVLPWLAPLLRARPALRRAGELLDVLFLPMCHRLPERTLQLGGIPMPLCSRCAGIFAGLALGGLIARPRAATPAWRRVILAAGALMVIDVATQDLALHPVWHPTRLATGALFGYAVAAAFVLALSRELAPPLA